MRLLSGFLFFLLFVGCSNQNHLEKLNGTWELVAQEIGGMKLPVTASLNQTLVINGEEYSMTAESVDKGTISANETQLDIFGTDGPNAGKTFKAIYKLENDKLTICYNLSGDSYPEEFSTDGKAMFFMATFEKAN